MTTSWFGRPISSSASWAWKRRLHHGEPPAGSHAFPLILALTAAFLGQSAEAQIRYTAAQLDSARFRHTARSEIQTTVAGRERRERVAVAGLLVVNAEPESGRSLALEAWYDSLQVRRSAPEGTLQPDTDGIIGGRYRGRLGSGGSYAAEGRPFVPEGVAEVVDLSRVLDELFPALPPPLQVGERWQGGDGVEIQRLADSIAKDTLLRFRASRSRFTDAITATGDSGTIPARQTTREHETFAWHPRRGLARRDRTIVVETDIPGGGTVGRPVRSRLEQRIVIERLP
jgi:hypothetical protein